MQTYNNGGLQNSQDPEKVLPVKSILLVLFVFALLYLPFLNKAFQIDDYAFLHLSQTIGWNPLHAIPENWGSDGNLLRNFLPYEITHPLLVSYLLKILIALFGTNEIALHLAFMVFPLLAIFSLIKLNELLFPPSSQAVPVLALFFCSMPAFLVNSQNLMADIATLALILFSLLCFLTGMEKPSRRMLYLGSLALTLALFCSYHAGFFLVLIFAYALMTGKFSRHLALSLVLPVVALLLWLSAVYVLYGLSPIKSHDSRALTHFVGIGLEITAFLRKVFSTFALIGAAMMWVLPLYYALKRKFIQFLAFMAVTTTLCYAFSFRLTGCGIAENVAFSLFFALGFCTMMTMVRQVWTTYKTGKEYQPELFLLLWFLIVIGYLLLLFPFSSARYLLPAFPPVFLLFFKDPVWKVTTAARRGAVYCVLCASLLFGFASAFSDYQFSDAYRQYAAKVKTFRADGANAFNVWFIGEWGMRYYMEQAGAKYLLADDAAGPQPGDFVVLPEMPRLWDPAQGLQDRMVPVGQRPYSSWLPLRLFNRRSNAGFYCNAWGMLPFSLSYEPDEVFSLGKVIK